MVRDAPGGGAGQKRARCGRAFGIGPAVGPFVAARRTEVGTPGEDSEGLAAFEVPSRDVVDAVDAAGVAGAVDAGDVAGVDDVARRGASPSGVAVVDEQAADHGEECPAGQAAAGSAASGNEQAPATAQAPQPDDGNQQVRPASQGWP